MKKRPSDFSARPAARAGFCLFLLTISSCQMLQRMASIRQPTLEADNVRLKNLSFESADLVLKLSITNPNPIGVTLNGFDYDLQIEGASLLKGNQTSGQTIAPESKSPLEIPVTLLFKDVYTAVQTLQNRDSAGYKISCGLLFDLPVLGGIRVPVSQSGHLPLIRLPQIKIQSLKVKKTGLTGADLDLVLGVTNPNAFAFELKKLNYDFSVNGQPWAKGASTDGTAVGKKSGQTIHIPVSLSFLEMGRTAVQLLSGDRELDCRLTGDLNLGTSIPAFRQASIPLDLASKINLTK
jgi:LEA14-like dessication related protein